MKKPSNFLPAPELKPYIAAYGILEIPEGETESYFSPPLALSGFIFNLAKNRGFTRSRIENRDFFTDNAVVTGQVTAPVYGEMVGELKSLMIFFRPSGMHRLFGNDLSELTNTSKPLSDFLGQNEADLLLKDLTTQSENEKQIAVLNEFFRSRIPAEEKDEKFEKILDYIHSKQGDLSINEILETSFYPRRTLERHFKRKVGLSPKAYVQIYRFKCLIRFLENNPEITWSQLANQSGYFDQSHMSRYMKEYLKVSPNSLVTLDMEFINYLLNR